jgi:hypothetical protein
MTISTFWTLVIVGIVVLAVVGLVVVRNGMKSGQTPPGPPSHLYADTHDEPLEDTAKNLDAARHAHSSEDVAKAARDEERLLGH